MTSKGFAVAASDVGGAFVKDLATELGKSPSTLVAYLKKHLPTTLVKRKNSNNRQANFCTADGVAGLRAHYKPTYAEVPNALVQELERLRDENKRLRLLFVGETEETIEELEARITREYEEVTAEVEESSRETDEVLARGRAMLERMNNRTKTIWRETNELRQQQEPTIKERRAELRELLDKQDADYEREEEERKSRVLRFPSEKVRKSAD